MLRVRDIPCEDWSAIAGGFGDFSFEQSATYSRAAARRIGAELRFLTIGEGDRVVACACVRIKSIPGLGRGIAWIASGPLMVPLEGPAPEPHQVIAVLTALREKLAVQDGHILRLRLPGAAFHDVEMLDAQAGEAGFQPSDRAPTYRSVAIDVTKDDEALMKGFAGKWRTDLRYALKSDLGLERGRDAGMQARFMALFREVQQAKGFSPDITPEFHFDLNGDDYAWEVLIATKDGQDIAGLVIGWSGTTAVYLFGATAEAGRKLRAGYFLTWSGLGLARGRGMRWYDMGGIDEEANPSVARFKRRMNGQAVLSPGPYEARAPGLTSSFILRLEALRTKLKGR